MDVAFKYGGATVFLLLILYWLANNLKLQMFEQGMKQDAYTALTEQLESLRKDFDKERDKLEEAYKERNEAISEVKKWQSLAQRLERDVEEMREEIRQSSIFIRSLLNNIHKFTQEHPEKAQYLEVSEFPNKD